VIDYDTVDEAIAIANNSPFRAQRFGSSPPTRSVVCVSRLVSRRRTVEVNGSLAGFAAPMAE